MQTIGKTDYEANIKIVGFVNQCDYEPACDDTGNHGGPIDRLGEMCDRKDIMRNKEYLADLIWEGSYK